MAIFKIFKAPTHQQFSYKPRYWDPKKEESQKRADRVQLLQDGGVEGAKARISGGFRKGAGGLVATGTYRNQRVKRANGTLFIVIIALLIVSYFAIEVYFPDLSSWLESELPQADPAAPAERELAPLPQGGETMELEDL